MMKRWLPVLGGLLSFLVCLPPIAAGQEAATLAHGAQIQARHERDILTLPGVIGMGIGQRNQQLIFLVLVDENAPMPSLPAHLEGIPVVAEWSAQIILHNGGDGCNPCHAAQQALPTPMGVSTSTDQECFAGTLGFKACHPATRTIGYVSNNHVAAAGPGVCENGLPGLTELHRGTIDAACTIAQTIGQLHTVVPIQFPGPNLVDAAFVESTDVETSASVLDIGVPTSTPGVPALNQCVQKSGRSTGLTFGRIIAVNVTVGVGGYCGGVPRFQQQLLYVTDPACGSCLNPPCSMSRPGDSGSPVLDLANNIVGLNFAGAGGFLGVGNTIQNVLSTLGLTLDLTACAGNECPLSQGFWKTHPDAWPRTSLTLGSQTYTQAELLTLLDTPVRGDASLILAHQLIAAKLNIANASNPAPISATIADADTLLSGFTGKLPYNVRPSSAIGQRMVDDASVLDAYNNGDLTPDCTP